MNNSIVIRILLAIVISISLAFHGFSKKSLDITGSIAAILVGFIAFATSYRFGIILILFYYTSSKLTKVKEDVKQRLESNYMQGGQRNYVQVFANSILATIISLMYMYYVGEDRHMSFSNNMFGSYLSTLYVGHYAC